MISKIFLTGQLFPQTCAYVCQDLERAVLLDVEGVREHDLRLMAYDFGVEHSFRREREKPVFHGMLSFPPGEDPGDVKLVQIAREYLQEIGMSRTQFAIVKHTDKAHLHLHIIANRINFDGEIIGEGLIIERGIKAAQKLTREHRLVQEQGKNLQLTHLEALHHPDDQRYRLYQAIHQALPGCRRLEDLEEKLLKEEISLRYRLNAVDGEREGISFHTGKSSFAGYKVDPGYSLKNLEKTLSLQREQELRLERKQQQELELRQQEEERLHLRHSHGLGL
jgi:Relaxase/Mobilisation nuclease domain